MNKLEIYILVEFMENKEQIHTFIFVFIHIQIAIHAMKKTKLRRVLGETGGLYSIAWPRKDSEVTFEV